MSCSLSHALAALESIAPLGLAADWDNVGLLLEPRPASDARIEKLLLTIDLTEAVLAEAIEAGAGLIVTYHPPLFSGVKRLTQAVARERVVLGAVLNGLFVYSPHTALDACREGVNDWLLGAFGPGESAPIEPDQKSPDQGQGRLLQLAAPLALNAAVARIKAHLGLAAVRVARPAHSENPSVQSVAVCAGAGGSVLEKVRADLYLTGEMRHHDILAKQAEGSSVVVCDHTNTERGYLPLLARRLREALHDEVELLVSERDADPLQLA